MAFSTATSTKRKPARAPSLLNSVSAQELSALSGSSRSSLARSDDSTARLVPHSSSTLRDRSSNRRRPSIDEMASALLDDTTVMPGNGARNRPFPWPIGSTMASENYSNSRAVRGHPITQRKIEKDISFEQALQMPFPVEKRSPAIPRKLSKRTRQSNVRRRESPRSGSGAGLIGNLPRSKTGALDPLGLNPPRLAPSTSMPITQLLEKPEERRAQILARAEERLAQVEKSDPFDAALISRKLEMMLAANKALKPEPLPPILSRNSSKASRFAKPTGLFKKISGALADRIHHKSQSKTTQTKDGDAKGMRGKFLDDLDTLPPLTLPDQPPPISTNERHLNVSKNLNMRKVQMMTGERIMRKPVPNDGRSLRSPPQFGDPFSDAPNVKRAPTEFENRLRASSVEDSTPPLPTRNPFESEKVLEGSLDSILSTVPIASSTPRIRNESPRAFSESPTKKPRCMSVGHMYGGRQHSGGFDLCAPRGESKDEFIRPATSGGEQKSIDSSSQYLELPTGGMPSYVQVVGNGERKKHPSPSKPYLDLLVRQFREEHPEVPLGCAADFDETDELANSTVTIPANHRAVGSIDRYRLPSISSSRDGDDSDLSENLGQNENNLSAPKPPVRKTSAYRPIGITRSYTEARFTFKDQCTDLDELQMDVGAVTYGHSPVHPALVC
ncbi:hypothetical protein QBC46DRAFT_424854 [Diplogelasinospora grovesii]|uniref:Uncharacterized protein n=1 Tax=Diplogelasinospora grovesii TaxID=303347 RepID=A0AAN6SAE7_9PEZI|nr:hypothetical protein QBC46DRAFT_424854 [Diplogelasinospora grovesii]